MADIEKLKTDVEELNQKLEEVKPKVDDQGEAIRKALESIQSLSESVKSLTEGHKNLNDRFIASSATKVVMAMAVNSIMNNGVQLSQAEVQSIANVHKEIYKRDLNVSFVAKFNNYKNA